MNIYEKITEIQNELRVTKDGENTFAKYTYFQPDTILRILNPLLKKHGVFTLFNLNLKGEYYQAELKLIDTLKPEDFVLYNFDILKATVKGANEAQNSGATLTYAKRYSLMNALNIAENSADFDSDAHAEREKKATLKSEIKGRFVEISKRNYGEETKDIKTKDDYVKWLDTIINDEQAMKDTYQLRQAIEFRLTSSNITKVIAGIKSNTPDKTINTINTIIDSETDPTKKQELIDMYNQRLEEVGHEFRYEREVWEKN